MTAAVQGAPRGDDCTMLHLGDIARQSRADGVRSQFGDDSRLFVLGDARVRFARVSKGGVGICSDPVHSSRDVVVTVMVLDGEMVLTRGGLDGLDASTRFTADQAFYLVSGADCSLAWSQGTRAVFVVLPRATVEGYGLGLDAGESSFAVPSAILGPARGFFSQLGVSGEQPGALATYALGRLAEEMIASLLLESLGAPTSNETRQSLYQAALALMAAKRSDISLSPLTIALESSVSLRHLQRSFRSHGKTVTGELRRLRVELAVSYLTAAAYAPLSIAEIAAYAGFASVVELRRAFKIEGLAAPSAVRSLVAS